MNDFERYAVRS